MWYDKRMNEQAVNIYRPNRTETKKMHAGLSKRKNWRRDWYEKTIAHHSGDSFTEDDKYQRIRDNICNQYGGRYAVFRDHPELLWLLAVNYSVRTGGEWIYDDEGGGVGYRMTGMYYENTYPWVPPEAYIDPAALEKAADNAVAAIDKARPSRAATVRAIHDDLCGLVFYGERSAVMPDRDGGNTHTVNYDHVSYSVLVAPNTGVCNAYAAAFKPLRDRYRIPCVHLSGATPYGPVSRYCFRLVRSGI